MIALPTPTEAEHANTAVSDESGGCVLRTSRVAVAVLGFLKLELGALESGAEAVVTSNGGSRRSIDADNADLAFRDALRSQLVDHGLTGSLTGRGVVGAERRNRRREVRRGIDVDDLHASRRGLLQRIVDRLGAVGRQKDRVRAVGDGVVDHLDLLRIVLHVGRSPLILHVSELFCRLLAAGVDVGLHLLPGRFLYGEIQCLCWKW